jgi:lysophospholipid acyltransferase (LPLAT)-like uncharacterized protein
MHLWQRVVRIGRSQRVLRSAMAWLLPWLVRGLLLTLRPVYVQEHVVHAAAQSQRPVLLACWHGRMLCCFPLYRRYRLVALVSRSKDGEFVGQVLARLGIAAVRGSSSRDGARGLLALIHKIREGYVAVVTPDGPRGPRYTAQAGVVVAAAQTQATIVPVTYNARWKKVMRTWDRCVVPLPWSRVVVVYGAPIAVPAGGRAEVIQAKRRELETSLHRITAMADSYFERVGAG